MGLKRKRSTDESPLSASSFGTAPTPEAQSPTPMPDAAMDIDISSHFQTNRFAWDFSSVGRVKGGDWGNRTRKRFRDNRPDERVIHENTINKLFSAQRKHPHAEPIMSDSLPQNHAPAVQKPQKSTLHSFWNLPAPPVQPPTIHIQPPTDANTPRCQDCDTWLHSEAGDMDVDMDIDGPLERSVFGCHDCGRNVCGTCAVVSNTRHCLQCATSARNSKRWW
ncbi:hypothetical protein BU26DRAFT_537266 [Trematosphaeria pertusa]|uniref:Uncharacterized protein n=1 Tax=Trematosphaeria pertusa TaxID=390896 RepID=A0A6A6IWR1_9PLEO|nr:uncharacterized protein BU26DRAFT_537266 [Trematosphaeria pertusa]KAF2254477.1 hypothetical protein BU26DRAFT_537266 [Trematosphaeria pertusa]